MELIRICCEKNISKLKGKFIFKKNAYEKELCEIMGWDCEDNRYWDAKYSIGNETIHIEIKKGQNGMWFDLVRYAETYNDILKSFCITRLQRMKLQEEDIKKDVATQLKCKSKNTVTAFFKYNKNEKKILEIYLIEMNSLLDFFNMCKKKADCCIYLKNDSKRTTNIQYSISVNDMKKIATHIITRTNEISKKPTKKKKKKLLNKLNKIDKITTKTKVKVEKVDLKKLIDNEILKNNSSLKMIYHGTTINAGTLMNDGKIKYSNKLWDSPSSLATHLARTKNPDRKSVNGWSSLFINNKNLSHYRRKYEEEASILMFNMNLNLTFKNVNETIDDMTNFINNLKKRPKK